MPDLTDPVLVLIPDLAEPCLPSPRREDPCLPKPGLLDTCLLPTPGLADACLDIPFLFDGSCFKGFAACRPLAVGSWLALRLLRPLVLASRDRLLRLVGSAEALRLLPVRSTDNPLKLFSRAMLIPFDDFADFADATLAPSEDLERTIPDPCRVICRPLDGARSISVPGFP